MTTIYSLQDIKPIEVKLNNGEAKADGTESTGSRKEWETLTGVITNEDDRLSSTSSSLFLKPTNITQHHSRLFNIFISNNPWNHSNTIR